MVQSTQRPMSRLPQGSPTAESHSATRRRYALTWTNSLLAVSRVAVLAAVLQTGWYFGGTNSGAILATSVLLILALATCLMAIFSGWRPQRFSALVWLPGCLLAAYVLIQCLPVSWTLLDACAPKLATVYRQYAVEPAEQVIAAGNLLRSTAVEPAPNPSLSLIRYETERSLVTLLIALAIMITSSLVFSNHASRLFAMRAILINAAALAIWGIIQRARGTTDLLPGIPNPLPSIPFSSFIYKNSAAAAIIPGVAAAISLFYLSRLNQKRQAQKNHAINRYYRNAPQILTSRELGLLFVGGLVISGVIASLSRGGWIALGLSLVTGLYIMRREWLHSRGFIAFLIILVACVGITANIASKVERRLDEFTIEKLSDNERLEHWKLGWTTAKAYLPLGSGLGTYGYATLLEQTQPTRVWFADAHNQYLEVIEELGLFGIALLLITFVWCMKQGISLLDSGRSASSQCFGLFALMVLIAAAVQSIGDFVMKLPPNLFQLSLTVGMLGVITSTSNPKKAADKDLQPTRWHRGLLLARPIAICVCLMALTIAAFLYTSNNRFSERAMQTATAGPLEDGYDKHFVEQGIELLSEAIDKTPDRASLYRQRAMFHLAQFRHELMKVAAAENETLQWASTQPERIHVVLYSIPETSRELSAQRMTSTDALKTSLVSASFDLAQAISFNPTYSQAHATLLALCPLLQMPPQPWLQRFGALALSDPEKLYMCGLFAFYQGEIEEAKRYWRLSLQGSPSQANSICVVGLTKMSAVELASDVIPPEHPDLLINLVRTILAANFTSPKASLTNSTKIAMRIAESVESTPERYGDQSDAVAASIFSLAGDHNRSADAWSRAIEKSPRDWRYRYQAAEELRRCGRWDEAIRHASLGASLGDNKDQFEQLIARIQQQMQARQK